MTGRGHRPATRRLLPLSVTLLLSAVGIPKLFPDISPRRAVRGRVQANPAVSEELASRAQVELSAGIPFVSDKQVIEALDAAGVAPATADAVAKDYSDARLQGLRASMAVLAGLALVALALTRRLPTEQPAGAPPTGEGGDGDRLPAAAGGDAVDVRPS